MRFYLSLLFLWLTFGVQAQQYTVKTVPNTKLVNNSYVSNPDKILSDAAEAEINSMLSALEQQTTAQVAVVAIKDIGDADMFDFAQELFTEWGIGQAKEDNGLLILLVMEKRTVRLHVGYGLEGSLPDIVCKHIEMQKMVPYFKESNYDQGVIEGVREVVKIISDTDYSNGLKNSLYDSNDSDASTHDIGPVFPDLDFLFPTAIVWSIIMIIVGLVNWYKGDFSRR